MIEFLGVSFFQAIDHVTLYQLMILDIKVINFPAKLFIDFFQCWCRACATCEYWNCMLFLRENWCLMHSQDFNFISVSKSYPKKLKLLFEKLSAFIINLNMTVAPNKLICHYWRQSCFGRKVFTSLNDYLLIKSWKLA